ncbi:MAG: hypothetical protein QW286_00885 [Candidatus Aenigmatarchaeota archaeon]
MAIIGILTKSPVSEIDTIEKVLYEIGIEGGYSIGRKGNMIEIDLPEIYKDFFLERFKEFGMNIKTD